MFLTSAKFEKYLLIFTLVDILFAPYVFFLATTYSQFFVFLWFILKDKRVFQRKELKFYYYIMFFIGLSVIISLFTIPNHFLGEYVFDNFKRGLNIVMAISYYFFFSYFFKSRDVKLEKWIFALLIYVTLWGVLYYLNMSLFITIKRFFNPFDSVTNVFVLNTDFFNRYNFIWTDPNNIGYTIVGVVAFLIINKKTSNIVLIISVLALLFILLITMSGGSVLTAFLVIPVSLLVRFQNSLNLWSRLFLILSIVAAIYLTSKFSSQLTGSEIGETAILRLEDKTETEEPRLRIWKRLFEAKNVLLYSFAGEGSNLFINGKPYPPHNGHLAFIFGFGIICYYMYVYLFFRKSKTQRWIDLLYITPFLLCFTLNVGIGELKFAAIMYMLVAYSRTQNKEQILLNRLRQIMKLKIQKQNSVLIS